MHSFAERAAQANIVTEIAKSQKDEVDANRGSRMLSYRELHHLPGPEKGNISQITKAVKNPSHLS